MIITLKDGDVTIALRPDLAPKHVEQIKALVREGAYDNVAFHRVIDGFMAQTGDVQYRRHEGRLRRRARPARAARSMPDLPAEFSKRAISSAARSAWRARRIPNSANSQFFIMFAPTPPPRRPVHGRRQGRERHGTGRQDQEGRPGATTASVTDPDRMIKVRIAADKQVTSTQKESGQWPRSRTAKTRSSWKRPRARSSSSCCPTWRPAMSPASRNWPAKAPMTAWSSTASSTASWRRPAT